MTSFDTTASRFLRPADVARLRRNQRRVQLQRLFVIVRSVGLLVAIVVGSIWAWRQTQSDERFAVKTIEVAGVAHTPRVALDRVIQRYKGLNLFQIDIDRVQRDLGGLPWVSRVAIEKKVPDTLRIVIAERHPVALVRVGDRLLYADEGGTAFAELSPSVGNDDLPLITGASGAELTRSVALLRELRAKDREIYVRISEVRPIAPRGFAIFDRQLGAVVYANADDVSAKWRSLYAVLDAEQRPRIEYADLRFADRIVVKPARAEGPGPRAEGAVHADLPGPRPSSLGPAPQGAPYVQN
jgi:cell division protein FtsQ